MAPYAIDSNWPIERTTTAGGGIGRVNNKVISNTWQSMKMTILSRKMLSYIKESGDKLKILRTSDTGNSMLAGVFSSICEDPDYHEQYTCLSLNYYDLFEDSSLKRKFNNPWQSAEVRTRDRLQGNGFAESVYLSLLWSGYQLVSDYTQYNGARYLWRRLSHDRKLNMYVYDEINDKIVAEGHKINNVEYDKLDKEWTRDFFGKEKNMLFIVEKGE